ncbi:MAG: hypothetical protein KKD44_26100, partial [Proteobacteria bacterium]|nr:hypothetical protein [Pseudomonadota bacterium]
MPAVLERCIKHLMDDPKFKPKKKDQTKKEAAWAVCVAGQNKKKLTEENFDNDMKIIFSEWDHYVKFDEEIVTVTEELAKTKSTGLLWDHVRALEDSVYKTLDDENITDKKDKIKARIKEFGDLLNAEMDKLGKFTEWRNEVIPFTGEIEDYEVVDLGDKVQIKNLPIFMLGNHRNFKYDEKWAKDIAISGFEKNKSTGHLPAICIQHTYDEGGHPVPKEVKSFFDNVRLKGNVIYSDTLPIDKEIAKNFPYRSVEINPNTRRIDALAIHGAESVPYFKFKPVMFEEGKDTGDKKIILTFFDENFKQNEGGEIMKDPNAEKVEEKKKNFIQNVLSPLLDKFFKENDTSTPKVELFTEDDIKQREDKAKKEATE